MTQEELKEFKKKTLKVSEPRGHKIKNSLGIRDAFLFLQKRKWADVGRPLREQQFQHIVRGINNLLAFEIMEGREVVFPEKMGCLEVRKSRYTVKMVNGKIAVSYPVCWQKTLEMWAEDPETFKNRQLIYDTSRGDRFFILYNRSGADYNNKAYYTFRVNRAIYNIMHSNVKQGIIIDAYGGICKNK